MGKLGRKIPGHHLRVLSSLLSAPQGTLMSQDFDASGVVKATLRRHGLVTVTRSLEWQITEKGRQAFATGRMPTDGG